MQISAKNHTSVSPSKGKIVNPLTPGNLHVEFPIYEDNSRSTYSNKSSSVATHRKKPIKRRDERKKKPTNPNTARTPVKKSTSLRQQKPKKQKGQLNIF